MLSKEADADHAIVSMLGKNILWDSGGNFLNGRVLAFKFLEGLTLVDFIVFDVDFFHIFVVDFSIVLLFRCHSFCDVSGSQKPSGGAMLFYKSA